MDITIEGQQGGGTTERQPRSNIAVTYCVITIHHRQRYADMINRSMLRLMRSYPYCRIDFIFGSVYSPLRCSLTVRPHGNF